MSLVNRMLQDLEDRLPPPEARHDAALEGLSPARYAPFPARWRRAVLGLGAALALAGLVAWYYLATAPAAPTLLQAQPAAAPPPATPLPSLPDPEPPVAAAPPVAPAPPEPARLDGLRVSHQGLGSRLSFDLDRVVDYRIDHPEGGRRLRLWLDNTRLAVPLPDSLMGDPLIRELRSGYRDGGLYLELDLDRPTRVHSSLVQPLGSSTPQLTLGLYPAGETPRQDLAPPAPPPVVAIPAGRTPEGRTPTTRGREIAERPARRASVDKRPRTPSPAEQAEQHYRQALAAAGSGALAPALAGLGQALDLDPGHGLAREALAALLIRDGRPEAALELLNEGLGRDPDHPGFTKLQARLLVDRGQLDRAVARLEQALPRAGADPEYLALLAALYQRQGHHAQAAGHYAQALRLRGGQGAWWAGLGLSLEAGGDRAGARSAYAAARNHPLVAELKDYVEDRLRVLGP